MARWDWRQELAQRPWWMNLLFGFCLYMVFIYMPFDMFVKPVEVDDEVWLGFLFHGWAAKLTEPLHWAIYMTGAYGFWKMRPWMWPWAAVYVAQISIGMLVWSLRDPRGAGWLGGAITAAVFLVPTIALWRARRRFTGRIETPPL
ncbi:MAG: hypothetical protein NT024_13995 [Proteobacteria bacterium]|nr:hypothetical protein [Pseudomonadota bacterium]